MDSFSPKSYYDSLLIMDELPESLRPISFIEYHLFSYLGCDLALFQGNAVSNWGYSYTVTENGFPFSRDLQNSIDMLEKKGFIFVDENGLFSPNPELVTKEIENFYFVDEIPKRRELIKTSLECALSIPPGAIRYAIKDTPGFILNKTISQAALLLEEDDIDLLYKEYEVISELIGKENKDLLSPAVIWLSARVMRSEG
ncbi:hypothetical protein RYZ56_22695 [Enterobacter hormaechei]|uniref:hypothetical protein n=1 Tax=Enterobacter hormaechei TaxID=158836 RepID=UPI002963D723|nr:hypothetical protein [Enterobacter hormaechei]MDW2665783.1 hypothetical protein [Enterobacter hormaechei]MDW2675022.1 hypothetical protein [Enterobacter hormaechei]MDW2684395.1 hypothetical protein [Enterobacter hormaechei]MDW2774533.1 hypothetical protein [Enterobacter hormaechei]